MNTILLQVVNPNVNVTSVLPEIIVAVAGIIVMLYDCFAPKKSNRRNFADRADSGDGCSFYALVGQLRF
jgi:hypothetical protein